MVELCNRRSRLLGMERNNVSIQMDVTSNGEQIRSTLAGVESSATRATQFTPEMEARKLIEIMSSTGVLSEEVLKSLAGNNILELANGNTDRLSDTNVGVELPVDDLIEGENNVK